MERWLGLSSTAGDLDKLLRRRLASAERITAEWPVTDFWPANKQWHNEWEQSNRQKRAEAQTHRQTCQSQWQPPQHDPDTWAEEGAAARRVHEIESTTNINRLVTGYYARFWQCEQDAATYARERRISGIGGWPTAVADVKRTMRRHIKFYLTFYQNLRNFQIVTILSGIAGWGMKRRGARLGHVLMAIMRNVRFSIDLESVSDYGNLRSAFQLL